MAVEDRLNDYMLKQLDTYLGSVTNSSTSTVSEFPKEQRPAAALSQLNVGQMTFAELHTFNDDDDHFPIFHPNLVILFSRVLQEGNTSCLTTEQERLWNRYIWYARKRPSEDSGDSGDSSDSGDGCTCEPYVLPLMTTTVRGGAKLRDGTTEGDVQLDSAEGMYVDLTNIDNKITELEKKAAELNEEITTSSEETS